MLARKNKELTENIIPVIEKFAGNKNVSELGSFKEGTILKIRIKIQRIFGDGGAVLRIHKDFEDYKDIPFEFSDYEKEFCVYETKLNLSKGIYFWEILILRGYDTLFTSSENNKDFHLCSHSEKPFMLTIYEEKYKEPLWFEKGIMYQIFVDRFCRGEKTDIKDVPLKKGAILVDDFYSDNLEYAKIPGGEVKNNHFCGGTLFGVCEKLDYLKSLGVTTIYLNPVFDAKSNHKYDTGDYEHIDCMFGGDKAFEKLLKEAEKKKIKIILDGVFNHTGDDSKYFNRYKNYPTRGAYSGEGSKYYDWYNFKDSVDEYECWWNIKILPRLNHSVKACRRYFTGENGIGAMYVKKGIAGWRLDVADELSNEFLSEFSASVKGAGEDTPIIIGEVWENAAEKMAYSERRRYFVDNQLDSVMNYPLKDGIIKFCVDGDAKTLYNILTEIYATYPKRVSNCLMNLLGTHDTERILTLLSIGAEGEKGSAEIEKALKMSNDEKANFELTAEELKKGKELLYVASALQYTVYGVPSLYYGDEIGLLGFRDPFSRKTYKWGKEDKELLQYYKKLGEIRTQHKAFDGGDFSCRTFCKNGIEIKRSKEDEEILIFALCKAEKAEKVRIKGQYLDLLSGEILKNEVEIKNNSVRILQKQK